MDSTLLERIQDICHFLITFHTPISVSTPHIYISGRPFLPSQSRLGPDCHLLIGEAGQRRLVRRPRAVKVSARWWIVANAVPSTAGSTGRGPPTRKSTPGPPWGPARSCIYMYIVFMAQGGLCDSIQVSQTAAGGHAPPICENFLIRRIVDRPSSPLWRSNGDSPVCPRA